MRIYEIKVDYNAMCVDYATGLVSKFEDRNVLIKTLLLFHAIVSKFPRLLYVMLHAGIRGIFLRKKIQIF